MPVISTIAAATARAFGAFKSAAGGAADEFFDYVTLLLHGDGTNGAQNNTFLDSSTNNFTITRNGNTTQGTFSPFSQTGWSNYFDGSGDYLTAPDNAAWDFGTGDFTIETWVYPTTSGTQRVIASAFSSSGNNGWSFEFTSGNLITLYAQGAFRATSSTAVLANTWTHIAVSRSGTSLRIFINGVLSASATDSTNITGSTGTMTIAATPSGTAVFTGYQSNFRVVTGTAVYTAAFTPPTSPLTAIANTSLLTCQSNRFRDASSNNFAITVNGDTSVQAFSPFAPTAAYSAATVGGSGYFDGSGDYLTVPDNAAYEVGSDNFTEEFWIYPTSASMTGSIIDKRSSAGNYSECPQIQIASNQPIAYVSYSGSSWAVNINGSSNVKPYSWNHIALTRSSSTWTLWLNGASVGSATSSGTVYAGSSSLVIGAASSAGEVPITGYLSSVRIVKGTALYTSAFTPPTAPLTAVANTQLLLNFTNGGIIDNTAKNVLETVGNAQISTSVKKFGTGSLAFDGTGDVLTAPASQYTNYINGSGDWTYEFWVYYNALPSGGTYGASIYAQDDGAGIVSPFNIVQQGNTWKLWASTNGSAWDIFDNVTLATTSLSTSTWYHIAFVRNAGTLKMYVNGTQAASTTLTANIQTNTTRKLWLFGTWQNNPSNAGGINGYIDDLRITKGVARYTTTFTPPTAAFADQ